MKASKYILAMFFSLLLQMNTLSAASWSTYVAGEGDLTGGVTSFLQIPSNTGLGTVLPQPPGELFTSIAITPDAATVFVPSTTTRRIFPIDVATNTYQPPIVLIAPASTPSSVGITPDGQTLLVTTAGVSSSLVKVDLRTPAFTQTVIPLPNQPLDLAVTPDGSSAYITQSSTDSVIIVDLNSNTVDPTPILLTTGSAPVFIAITPNGRTALVVESNPAAPAIAVIDLTTNTLVSEIPVTITAGSTLGNFAITPDGSKMYLVVGDSTVSANNEIIPFAISGTTLSQGTAIPLAAGDLGAIDVAFTPDGKNAYVTSFTSNTLTEIIGVKTANPHSTFSTSLPSGSAFDLIITPDQAPAASFTFIPPVNTTTVTFNASASSSPVGTIASYIWDFGDGSPIQTVTNPIITHTFLSSGPHTLTLTVVNTGGTSTDITFTGKVVSNNGSNVAVQTQIVVIPILSLLGAPTDAHGRQVHNRFLTQTDVVNILKWHAPTTGNPVSYLIFRDSALTQLIATIPASGKLKYEDHNRHKNKTYTYFIVSQDANGNRSLPAVVEVFPGH